MIADVRDTVKRFLQETIEAKGVRIITILKAGDGWIAEAEVAEKSQYLASIKPEYRVFDKEHYIVRVDASLEVLSYKRGSIDEDEV